MPDDNNDARSPSEEPAAPPSSPQQLTPHERLARRIAERAAARQNREAAASRPSSPDSSATIRGDMDVDGAAGGHQPGQTPPPPYNTIQQQQQEYDRRLAEQLQSEYDARAAEEERERRAERERAAELEAQRLREEEDAQRLREMEAATTAAHDEAADNVAAPLPPLPRVPQPTAPATDDLLTRQSASTPRPPQPTGDHADLYAREYEAALLQQRLRQQRNHVQIHGLGEPSEEALAASYALGGAVPRHQRRNDHSAVATQSTAYQLPRSGQTHAQFRSSQRQPQPSHTYDRPRHNFAYRDQPTDDLFANTMYNARAEFHPPPQANSFAGWPRSFLTAAFRTDLPLAPAARPQMSQPFDVPTGPGAIGERDILSEVLFSGETPPKDKEFALKPFIHAMETRKMRFGWSDARTVQHAASCFRGMAHEWFEGDLKPSLTPQQFQEAMTQWLLFRQLLIDRFDYSDSMHLNLGAMSGLRPHERNETDLQYIHRIGLARGANYVAMINARNFQDPSDYAPPTSALDEQLPIDTRLRLAAAHGYATCVTAMGDSFMQGMLAEGLHDAKLREWATRNLRQLSWLEFSRGIVKEYNRLQKLKGPAHQQQLLKDQDNRKSSFRSMVADIEATLDFAELVDRDPIDVAREELADQWSADLENIIIAAINRRKNIRPTNKRKPRANEPKQNAASKPSTSNTTKPSLPPKNRPQCSFCKRYGHTIEVCFRKEAFDEGRKEKDKGQHF